MTLHQLELNLSAQIKSRDYYILQNFTTNEVLKNYNDEMAKLSKLLSHADLSTKMIFSSESRACWSPEEYNRLHMNIYIRELGEGKSIFIIKINATDTNQKIAILPLEGGSFYQN
jgi:hypothetical protein